MIFARSTTKHPPVSIPPRASQHEQKSDRARSRQGGDPNETPPSINRKAAAAAASIVSSSNINTTATVSIVNNYE